MTKKEIDQLLKIRIDRRDFLNGMMIASGNAIIGSSLLGGALLSGCSHSQKSKISFNFPDGGTDNSSNININKDPRALRGGNLPIFFSVGHWMRDRRLKFNRDSVQVSASSNDSMSGTFPIYEDNTNSDVIILGSGMSGLSSAFFLLERNPKLKISIIDANQSLGGNAARDDLPPLPFPCATGAAYAVAPYSDFLKEIYDKTGVRWESYVVPEPFYNYFFDDQTPYALKGARGWVRDVYGKGLSQMPYPAHILRQMQLAKADFIRWNNTPGSPTDPADRSDPKYDYLAGISLDDYLTKNKKYHPAVSDFYTRFTVDALGGTCSQVSAYSGISFIGAEYQPIFAYPGGNAGIARHLLATLVPEAFSGKNDEKIHSETIDYQKLDSSNSRVRFKQGSIALQVDTSPEKASVIYFKEDRFYRASAKTIIVATQAHSARNLVHHLIDPARQEAWRKISQVPVVVANVAIRSAAPLVDLGLGYNQYWWGSKFWADFVTADWMSPNRMQKDRPTVLTFYGGNAEPAEMMPAERAKIFSRPFIEYENSLREDLARIFTKSQFDFDRDVSSIYLYRWGHGMIMPKPGYVFPMQKKGHLNPSRLDAPRHIVRKPLGRVFFAGQELEGAPSLECAIASGHRAAEEALGIL